MRSPGGAALHVRAAPQRARGGGARRAARRAARRGRERRSGLTAFLAVDVAARHREPLGARTSRARSRAAPPTSTCFAGRSSFGAHARGAERRARARARPVRRGAARARLRSGRARARARARRSPRSSAARTGSAQRAFQLFAEHALPEHTLSPADARQRRPVIGALDRDDVRRAPRAAASARATS